MFMNVIVVTVLRDIIARRSIFARLPHAEMVEYVWTLLKDMMGIHTNAYVLMVSFISPSFVVCQLQF